MEILLCKTCQTENSADSKYCKMCGQPVKTEAMPLTHEEAEVLLEDGFKLVGAGQVEEATFIADSVLDANPDNPKAHALKGMIHEEKGDLVAALAAFEHVVRLRPESTIDRIKLGQIRRRLESEPVVADIEVRSRNWVAIGSAIGATLAVVALGVVLALPKPSDAKAKEGTLYTTNSGAEGFNFPAATTPNNATPQNPGTITAPTNQNPPVQNRPSVGNPMTSIGPLEITPSIRNNNNGSALPEVGHSTGLQPVPKGSGVNTAASANPGTTMRDPDVIEPKKQNPGRIVITESKGGAPANPSDPSVSDNIYRVAQQKMATGDYRGAIRDFSTALSGTKRPGLIHQLIARCYARIGDTGNARQHFQSALDIYERSGAANEARACKRELELLG